MTNASPDLRHGYFGFKAFSHERAVYRHQ